MRGLPAPWARAALDELLVLDGEHGGSHQPHVDRDRGDADGQEQVLETGPEGGHDGQGEQDVRDGQQDVGPPHDYRLEQAAEVAGHGAQPAADGDGENDGDEADDHRNPRPVHDAAQHVAAEVVGAAAGTGGCFLFPAHSTLAAVPTGAKALGIWLPVIKS